MKHVRSITSLLALSLFSFIALSGDFTAKFRPSSAASVSEGRTWPRVLPCRINDGANSDLFIMTLGDVQTPIATGVFDPSVDEVRLNSGAVLKHFYRDSLGVKYFTPIDKHAFPVPPSGWCSWYYYYQEVDEREIERNAQWVADSLKEYGAEFVQIDDGWQGSGHGSGENRDWTTIDKRFPHGMHALAAYIKKLGLRAGLWLAPHGQSNAVVVRNNPGAFLLNADTSVSDTWEGKFLLDPTVPEAHTYLKNLFDTLSRWGYDYFKIDGQPIVLDEYRKKASFMKNPGADIADAYRKTIRTIRNTIGNDRYLLGCWGIPLEGIGIMNGSRTGGDVLLGWDGFKVSLDATMKYYYLHNIAWYCDPDVMLLRSPLSLDQARAWATLQGLTGQALMASDRMTDLSRERVDILRRVFPAVDIRPLDLFPSTRNKQVWDLKVSHLGRVYDVVGLFNFDEKDTRYIYVSWDELGLNGPVHVYDFWSQEYLGCWDGGMSLAIPPTSCRVLTLLPSSGSIQLISTNRHITQGWVDLQALSFNQQSLTFTGKSKVVKNDPYRLCFVYQRGQNFAVKSAQAAALPVAVSNHQGWSAVEFISPLSAEISWNVTFEPADLYKFPVRKPANLTYTVAGLDGVTLHWSSQYYLNAGYTVWVDGRQIGYTPANAFAIRNLDPAKTHVAQVASVWADGTMSSERSEVSLDIASMIPEVVSLSDLEPVRSTIGWGTIEMDRAVSGRPLSISGKRFSKGIGTHADSDLEFALHGLFLQISGFVGIDEGNGSKLGSVEFDVFGDGKRLWRSGVVQKSDEAKGFTLNIVGVKSLLLRVSHASDGIDYDHADWADVKMKRKID